MTTSSTYQITEQNKILARITGIILLLILGYCAMAQNTLVGLSSNGGPAGKGTAFSITTSGTNFSIIKGFADWGKIPTGNLFLNDDGNFYGMTSDGGTFNYGSIFTMATDGKITMLRQFDNANDGGYPNGELIKGADGFLYGATTNGGVNSYGTIFKISTAGDFTVIKSMLYNDGVAVYGHLTLASDGNFYGITYRGGTTGNGTIFKLTSGGVYSVIHNLTTAEGTSSVSSLTEGSDGNLYGATGSGGANGYGTIFKTTKGGQLTVLKSFNSSTDGYYCKSDLIQAKDGNFYGTCSSGGANGSGTIFKISSSGTYTVVKNFSYSTDGGTPNGTLYQNSDGNFYGTTKSGGAKSGGTIYKLTTSNAFSVIHALDFTTEGNSSSSTLIKGSDGKLYAMAQLGGTYNMGTAFSVGTDGTFKVLANFNGATQGNASYASFIKGKDSAYYGTTSTGGDFGFGTVIKICGGVTTVVHSFKQATDGGNPKAKLLLANDGIFYGTTSTGGTNGYGTIYKITSGGTFSVFYNFKSADGINPLGALIQAKDGSLYGMTSYGGVNGYGTIYKISLSGTYSVVRSFVYSTDGSTASGSLLQANDGNFYGMTTSGAKIFKLTTTGTFSIVHTFNSSSEGAYPYGSLMQAADGNLYGTCSEGGVNGYGTIFQYSLTGIFKVIRSLTSATDGRAPKGSLLQGNDGMLYGTTSIGGTYNNGTIFKISTSGTYSVLRQMNIRTDGGTALGDLIFAPVNNLVASAQAVNLNEDTLIKITLTGSGGSPLTYTVIDAPAHGKLSGTAPKLTYKPNANYNGIDQFSFNVSVGCMASSPAIVSITVKPMPDSPKLATIGNKTVTKDSLLTFTAKATDADKGQVISYSLIGAPTGATINKTSGAFKWTPSTTGKFTFKVRATDNDTPPLYDEEQITVTVTTSAALSIERKSLSNELRANVYPNPVDDILHIITSIPVDKLLIKVFDLKGSLIITKEINMSGNIAELNVSSLSRGFYIIQFKNALYNQSIKFLKK